MEGPQNNPYSSPFVAGNYILNQMKIAGTFYNESFQIIKHDKHGQITMTGEETIIVS